MELRKRVKLLAFITSYLPLWILLAVSYLLKEDDNKKLVFKQYSPKIYSYSMELKFFDIELNTFGIIYIFLIAFSIVITLLFLKKCVPTEKNTNIEYWEISEIESNDSEVLSYIFTYIIPFVTSEGEKSIILQVILIIMTGIFYVTSSSLITLNPILRLFGYFIYKVNLKKAEVQKTAYIISKLKENQIKEETIRKISRIEDKIYFL